MSKLVRKIQSNSQGQTEDPQNRSVAKLHVREKRSEMSTGYVEVEHSGKGPESLLHSQFNLKGLRFYQSINFKLFSLVAFFVISTIVYGIYLNVETTREALSNELDDRNIEEHLAAWK